MLDYCQLNPQEQNSVIFHKGKQKVCSTKYIWKYCLQHVGHFPLFASDPNISKHLCLAWSQRQYIMAPIFNCQNSIMQLTWIHQLNQKSCHNNHLISTEDGVVFSSNHNITGSTLVQVNICLFGTRHNLEQCWLMSVDPFRTNCSEIWIAIPKGHFY